MNRIVELRILAVVSILVLIAAACTPAEDAPDAAVDDPVAATVESSEAPVDEPTAVPEGEPAAEEPDPREVTAYVVGYHWGWVMFDEDGNELDVLEVPVGTTVELIAVNDHASHAIGQLPSPVAESIRSIDFHDRAHHDVEMGRMPDPRQAEGISLSEALAAAHDGHDHMGPSRDHGLLVTGVGQEAFLDAHADQPQRLMFTVEREGTHEFRCTEECGVGHENQRWEMLVVA